VRNTIAIAILQQLLSSFLAVLLQGIFHNRERIGNDMTTKIRYLWPHAKIIRIHHFSGHSKGHLTFRTLIAFDRRSGHEGSIFL
jgi:hypothetical protein